MINKTKHFSSSRLKNHPRQSGSALLVTLLVVSLLLVVVLGFVVTVRLELRTIANQQQLFRARANARLGMELAVAELQNHAGADKRVTGASASAGHTEHPHWAGVWQSDLADPTWTGAAGEPVWLVSGGAAVTPDTNLSSIPSILMVPADPVTPGSKEVRVPLEEMTGTGVQGRFGYWVGDEGVKARVDIQPGASVTGTLRERKLRSGSPTQPDMLSLGAPWNEYPASHIYARDGSARRNRLASRPTVSMAVTNVPVETILHDLTVHGYGLPVNVKDGGLKADWSVILDESMENTKLVDHYMGARPTKAGVSNDHDADIYAFPEAQIYNPDRFFLSDRIGTQVDNSQQRPGPNLGILWHYGRLWREISNNVTPMVGNHPRVESDIRRENWLPYDSANVSGNRRDQQHTNSTIAPLVSHLQLGFRLRSRALPAESDGTVNYRIQLELKPVIGMWNPYTVGIAPTSYLINWLPTPMIKLRIQTPDGTEEKTAWVRLIWKTTGSGALDEERWMDLTIASAHAAFEPGELRMYSVNSLEDQTGNLYMQNISLTPTWSSAGAILVDFRAGRSMDLVEVPEGSMVEVMDVYMQDTHHQETQDNFNLEPEFALTWLTLKAKGGSIYLTRHTGLWNGGPADRAAQSGEATIPARVLPTASNRINSPVEDLESGDHHMATWAFHLRTTTQMEIPRQRIRGVMDADPRAVVSASRWDGTREDPGGDFEGWNFVAPYMGSFPFDDSVRPNTTDGHDHRNRGLVSVGSVAEQAPDFDDSIANRYRGYLGPSNTRTTGHTHLALYDVPTAPLISVGQFQHAQLGRYSFEPGFVAGNSYANVRIPLDQTVANNFNGISGFDLYDISYDVNERLWDRMFFSTLAPDYIGGGTSWDDAFAGRLDRLPNPRMVYVPTDEEISLDAVLANAGTDGHRGAEALSSRIRILGAFNVNSTSKTAWKAVLSSMVTSELPVVNPANGQLSWEDPEGIRFNRFGHVLSSTPYESGDGNTAAFWRGWRKLSEVELDELAEAIVEEVRTRGPFRSMADFVNRDPDSSEIEHRRKGALQAALDRTVNVQGTDLPDGLGNEAERPLGAHFSDAIDGESEAAGYASYLLQGDVLQALAPILTARSDTFTIRSYGEIGDPDSPTAKVWCEAVVQRVAGYVKESDEAWRNPVDDTLDPLNARFGRHFEVVAFRWLDAGEVEGSN